MSHSYVIKRDPTPAVLLEKIAAKILTRPHTFREGPASDYELLRIRTTNSEGSTEILSIYRNNKGREKWHPELFRQLEGVQA